MMQRERDERQVDHQKEEIRLMSVERVRESEDASAIIASSAFDALRTTNA